MQTLMNFILKIRIKKRSNKKINCMEKTYTFFSYETHTTSYIIYKIKQNLIYYYSYSIA